ncbi:MAG: hypothetical protein OEO23_03720 [Gemmatimonadota bacterium]|nr:hypothetical protein [Gemmatimonadota bacterium]
MHRNAALSFSASLLVFGVGCAADVPEEDPSQTTGYAHAVYHDSCSPVDGYAQVLALTQTPVEEPYGWEGPRLTVDFFRPPFLTQEGVHESHGDEYDVGVARRCGAADDCQNAVEFRVRTEPLREDGTVEGYLTAVFPGGEVVAGSFSARHIPFEAICG